MTNYFHLLSRGQRDTHTRKTNQSLSRHTWVNLEPLRSPHARKAVQHIAINGHV